MSNLTKEKAALPLHTEHIHVERKDTSWLWMLLAVLGLGLLGLLVWSNFAPAPLVATTSKAAAAPVAPRSITYKNRQWELKGPNETFLPGEVKLLARSKEGDALYFNPKKGYTSGEGAEFQANTISTPSGRVYLKNGDGRYQPLFLVPLAR